MIINLKFNVRTGKFKPIKVFGSVEAMEQCSVCGDGYEGNLVGDKCYYLNNEKIQLQLCEDCFLEVKPNPKVRKR